MTRPQARKWIHWTFGKWNFHGDQISVAAPDRGATAGHQSWAVSSGTERTPNSQVSPCFGEIDDHRDPCLPFPRLHAGSPSLAP